MVAALGSETTQAALSAVEGLLSRRVGAPVELGEPEDLGGSGRTLVMRARVLHNNHLLPRTVVIKQLRAADHADLGHSEAFAREGAAYKFATALPVESRPGPQLLASDAQARILVLQDLGEGETMTERLRRTPSSETAMVLSAWAQALGRMHAGTYGRERDLSALARREHTDPRRDPVAGEAARAAQALPSAVGGIDDSARAVLDAAVALFTEGPFRAFSPSDVGPENTLVVGGSVLFLDYEWAGFRDGALDVAYVLLTYPDCTADGHSPELDEAIVEAWRSEVVRLWPRLADDVALHRHLATAALAWLVLASFWALGLDSSAAASRIDAGHLDSLPAWSDDDLLARWQRLADADPRVSGLARAVAEVHAR
ncbi:kae1-associated kinase [Tsukamurella serpentis]